MTTTPQKGRYLRLDGSPVEHGQLKRLFPGGHYSISFLAGIAADGFKADTLIDLYYPAAYAAAGMVERRLFNLMVNGLWLGSFHDRVIDTRPTARTPESRPPFYILRNALSCSVYFAVAAGRFIGVKPEDIHIAIPHEIPKILAGIQQAITCRNVLTRKWRVINRGDMELEPEAKPAATPTLAASPG